MSKDLILRPRVKRLVRVVDGNGNIKEEKRQYTWHDLFVIQIALEAIAEGKPISKLSLWLNIAGKLQYASEQQKEKVADEVDQEITIQLRNVEARKLCEELSKLPPERFARDPRTGKPSVPPLGALTQMLRDIGEQLGHEIVTDVDEEE